MKLRYFTLLEILAVMTIIVILLGIVMGGASVASRFALENRCLAQLSALEAALQQYKTDWEFYPEAENLLILDSNADWVYFSLKDKDGRSYIDNTQVGLSEKVDGNAASPNNLYYVDPYGEPFYYQSPGIINNGTFSFDIWSAGRDKKHGFEDVDDDKNGSVDDPGDAQSAGAKHSDDVNNWTRR